MESGARSSGRGMGDSGQGAQGLVSQDEQEWTLLSTGHLGSALLHAYMSRVEKVNLR